jgi:hypothetical protein
MTRDGVDAPEYARNLVLSEQIELQNR